MFNVKGKLGAYAVAACGCGAHLRPISPLSHSERMEHDKFFKKVYLSTVEGTTRRGRQMGIWKERLKEYVDERGVNGNWLEWARRERE